MRRTSVGDLCPKPNYTDTMKKLISVFALSTLLIVNAHAQENKEKLVDLISESNLWMNGQVVDKLFTIDLSPSMWEAVNIGATQPRGRDSFKLMAQALVDFSDKMGYTSLNDKCGYGVNTVKERAYRPACKKEIEEMSQKISFKYDAGKIEKNPDSYNLVLGYLTTVADFFNARSRYIENGWKPKGDKLNIVLAPSDKATGVKVAWSTDGQTATVTAPAGKEVAGWNDAILKGLEKGGK